MPTQANLTKKIQEITSNTADEADLYAYVRDLLTRKSFGIDLTAAQVVIDTSFDESRRRPDIAIYRTAGSKPRPHGPGSRQGTCSDRLRTDRKWRI